MTATLPPEFRTHEQRIAALKLGNDVRTLRKEMKADLKSGDAVAADLLEQAPTWLRSMKTYQFLLAIPGVGGTKARSLMRGCRISHAKTIGGLTERQRADLIPLVRHLRPFNAPAAPNLPAGQADPSGGASGPLSA